MKKILFIAAAVCLLASCGPVNKITKAEQYAKMYGEKPLCFLVMPPINNTTNVEAKDYLYTSICKPLSEAGYYVISPFMAMEILKAESAYDAELFVKSDLTKFKKYFAADAVVFSEINSWKKVGFTVQAEIRYFIRSATSGEILFDRTCNLVMDTSSKIGNTSSLLGSLVNLAASAVKTATTDNIEAARQANYFIFRDIPAGKYSPDFEKDMEKPAEAKVFSERISK